MKSLLVSAILSAVICVSVSAPAVTWYVDGSATESGNGLHPWTAFKTIQEGVDAGNGGDTVTVALGTYVENILFRGRNIVLVGNGTVIDGNQSGPVVTFTGVEDDTCVLMGFIIKGGQGPPQLYGGGIAGKGTHATIESNVITGNSSPDGGGLCRCDGIIRNNVIAANSGHGDGGGLYLCNGIIRNNTVTGNSSHFGGAFADCAATISNCIIWQNPTGDYDQLYRSGTPTYSLVEGWSGGPGGEGNIAGDPRFVDRDNGNYRLLVSSPCIDRGLNEDWMSQAVDLGGNERIIYGRSSLTVDIGAYEFDSFPLAIVELVREGADQARLTWFSRAGDTYAVWSCVDLCTDDWMELDTFPSQGAMTSWTDTSPLGRIKFYRVEMK